MCVYHIIYVYIYIYIYIHIYHTSHIYTHVCIHNVLSPLVPEQASRSGITASCYIARHC